MSRTLADLIAARFGLAISCERCLHTKTQDVAAMAVSYGELKTLVELEGKLAPCPVCNGKARFEVWEALPPKMGMKE